MKLKMVECPSCGGQGRIPAEVGEALRAEREKVGISIRELATVMGFSMGYIADLERDRRKWSNGLVEQYQDALRSLTNGVGKSA